MQANKKSTALNAEGWPQNAPKFISSTNYCSKIIKEGQGIADEQFLVFKSMSMI